MTPTRRPADQAIRDQMASDFATTIVLEAGAGKTTVLGARIIALVKTGTAARASGPLRPAPLTRGSS